MPCNFCNYLIEQEILCRRAHISANRAGEWKATAEILLMIRQTHVASCPRCLAGGDSKPLPPGMKNARAVAENPPEFGPTIFGLDESSPIHT